jgi:hypothetical protein
MNAQKHMKIASDMGRNSNRRSGTVETRKNKIIIVHNGMAIRRRIKNRKAGTIRM